MFVYRPFCFSLSLVPRSSSPFHQRPVFQVPRSTKRLFTGYILVMQFLEARAPIFYHVRAAGVFCKVPNNCQTPNNSLFRKTNLQSRESSGKQTMTEALWVSANFRWQVQNTGHRSDHKCRLEYRSPCNTLWCCKGAAVWMKGNKPIRTKIVVKKKLSPPKCKVIS